MIGLAASAPVLLGVLLVVGFSDALTDVAMNVSGIEVQRRMGRPVLSSMHAVWSIGAVLGGTAGAVIGHQMDQRARELQQNIAGARVERVGEGILVTFESGLLYDFNSADVKPAAQGNLRELARNFTKYGDTELLIVGHTDSVGSAAYNAALSQRRAEAAAAYLVQQGVPRSHLRVEGKGLAEPVAANDSEAGRQKNRRVEVAIFAGDALKQKARQQAGGQQTARSGR